MTSNTVPRQVLLIDYGDTVTVQQADISVMAKRFEEHRAFALECRLHGIRPAGQSGAMTGGWDRTLLFEIGCVMTGRLDVSMLQQVGYDGRAMEIRWFDGSVVWAERRELSVMWLVGSTTMLVD